MALTQSHYAFGVDDGTEATYTFLGGEDAVLPVGTIPTGVTFLLRFCVQANATGLSNVDFEFQYRKNGGTWTNITTTSSVVRAVASTALTNGGNCTKRLSGTGTFESSGAGQTEDGSSGGTANDIVNSGNSETVCSMQLVAGDVAPGDLIEFRLTRDGGTLLDTYSVTPSLEMAPLALTGVSANEDRYIASEGNTVNPAVDNTGFPNISADWGPTSLVISVGASTGAALRGNQNLESTVGYRSWFETYVLSSSMAADAFVSVNVGKEINSLPFDDPAVEIAYYIDLINIAGTLKFRIRFGTSGGEQIHTWSGSVAVNTTYKHYVEYNLVSGHIIYKVNDELVVDHTMDGVAVQSIGTLVIGSSGGSTGRNIAYLVDRIEEEPIDALAAATSLGLTGLSATGARGTLTAEGESSDVAELAGQSATGARGLLAASVLVALAGIGASASVGTLTPARSLAASNVLATGTVGTAAETNARTLSNVAANGAAGIVVATYPRPTSGAAAAGSAGFVTGASTAVLFGPVGTGATGTVGRSNVKAIDGTSATGASGTLTPLSEDSVALSGVSGSASTGSAGVTRAAVLSSLSATNHAGSIGVGPRSFVFVGQIGSGSVGSLSPTGEVVAQLSNVDASGQAGSVSAGSSGQATLLGSGGEGGLGLITTTTQASLSGMPSSATAGSPTTFRQGTLTTVVGTAGAGNVSAGSAGQASLSGNQGTGQSGALGTPTAQASIVGVQAAGERGSAAGALARSVANVAASSSVGPLSVSISGQVVLSGVSGAGAQGSLGRASQVALLGTSATGTRGSVSAESVGQVSLSGNEAQGNISGVSIAAAQKSFTGVSAAGAVGTMVAESGLTIALTSVVASGASGALGFEAGGNITLASATGATDAGLFIPSTARLVLGTSSVGARGLVSIETGPTMDGLEGVGNVAQPIVGSVVVASGVDALGRVGNTATGIGGRIIEMAATSRAPQSLTAASRAPHALSATSRASHNLTATSSDDD